MESTEQGTAKLGGSTVRLYGHRLGGGSFVQVTSGMRRALEAQGHLAGMVYSDASVDDIDDAGYEAPIALVLGGATGGLMAARRFGAHQKHWVMIAPNSERLPPTLAARLVEPSGILPKGLLDGGILTPSVWGSNVLRENFPDKPILVCPHGISEVFRVNREAHEWKRKMHAETEAFVVTHMSSLEHERKGTMELFRAWKLLLDRKALPKNALLHVTMSLTEISALQWKIDECGLELGVRPGGVVLQPAFSTTTEQVADMYRLSHLVCQPSRAEGFGLCPLEARACGVPVVQTTGTGMGQHVIGDAVVTIEQGPSGPMYDFPGSRAPTVDPEAIAVALTSAVSRWEQLAASALVEATDVAARFRWEEITASSLERMVELAT